MSSPVREVVSSSPVDIHSGSPVRRRSISPGDLADLSSKPPHHSPVSRTFDPNDPHVRERQRTMDVDMAMQLSLARRDTILSSPVSALTAVPNQPADHAFSTTTIPEEDNIPDFEQIEANDDLPQPSLDVDPHLQNNTEDVTSSNFGLPTYQANGSLSNFDFTRMEEFATAEKATLGLNTPINARLFLRSRPKSAVDSSTPMVSAEIPEESTVVPDETLQTEDGPSSGQLPLRQRKLSQSNPYPRSHRKGIGGKMALFENTPSFSTRLDLPFPTPVGDIPPNPSYDFIPGVPAPMPSSGVLNTGHDRPYRFSFYSNALSATIHARSLSELPADGQSFEQLFSGTPSQQPPSSSPRPMFSPPYQEPNNRFSNPVFFINNNNHNNNNHMGSNHGNGNRRGFIEKPNGSKGMHDMNMLNAEQDMNTWWLDVQSPTDEEMKMLGKVFSIHPLTTEDILMEETREKIELFRNYYLVCFRSFDQDPYSPTHLEPLNMYIIVFREGILSVCLLFIIIEPLFDNLLFFFLQFHFRPTPHPLNVRRRIKQLKDYISVTSDWISYALIDDITDAFGPLIQSIEYEVDSIDELVLILKETEQSDMLRRIGTCRKKVMGLLRLMGNKADVVKGLAKRCNENWRVAPTSDIVRPSLSSVLFFFAK